MKMISWHQKNKINAKITIR